MSKELKITQEKVLEASESCPDAKEVLKALFPGVFKEKKKRWVDVTKEVEWNYESYPEGIILIGTHDDEGVFYIGHNGLFFNTHDEDLKARYKIERELRSCIKGLVFRIFRKEE